MTNCPRKIERYCYIEAGTSEGGIWGSVLSLVANHLWH